MRSSAERSTAASTTLLTSFHLSGSNLWRLDAMSHFGEIPGTRQFYGLEPNVAVSRASGLCRRPCGPRKLLKTRAARALAQLRKRSGRFADRCVFDPSL